MLPILGFDLSVPQAGRGGGGDVRRGGAAGDEDEREGARLAAETRRHTWMMSLSRKAAKQSPASL